jgi:hypothetical protein
MRGAADLKAGKADSAAGVAPRLRDQTGQKPRHAVLWQRSHAYVRQETFSNQV